MQYSLEATDAHKIINIKSSQNDIQYKDKVHIVHTLQWTADSNNYMLFSAGI